MDKDKNGEIDKDELVIAMCKMHYKLSKRSPGVTEPPTAEEVDEKIAEFDKDFSGGLSKEEFFEFCKEWFDKKGAVFLQQLLLTAFISMVILPESAGMYVMLFFKGGLILKTFALCIWLQLGSL